MKKIAFGIVFLALVIAAVLFARRQMGDTGIAVKTAIVERGSIRAFFSATGTVINREELVITSPVLAKILELNASEGEFVGKGKILVKLDDRETRIQIEKTRTRLSLLQQAESDAKRDWDRLEKI